MNDSTKQKVITTVLGGAVLIWAVNNLMKGGDSSSRNYGEIAKEKVSVYDRLRADDKVTIEPDPLDLPLSVNTQKTPSPKSTIPQETSAEKLPAAKANPQESCSVADWKVGLCNIPESNSKNTTSSGSPKSSTKRPDQTSTGRTRSGQKPKSPPKEDMWNSLKSEGIQTIDGVAANNTGPMIKAHCKMLGLIQDGVVVSDAGRKEVITLTIKGPMPGCIMPDIRGFTIGAEASISPNKKWVTASVTTCTDPNPRRPSVPCKGVIQSITGQDVLEGEIYDKSFFGALLEVAINTTGIYLLKDLALASSEVDNVWAANTNAQIVQSFQAAIAQGAANIRETFSGREIHLSPGAPVIVTFTQDVPL